MINLSIGAFVLIVIGGCMLVCLLWMTIIIDELRKTVKDVTNEKHIQPEQKFRGEF